MCKIQGGMAAVVRMMLLTFFSKDTTDFNFKTSGIRVPTEADVFGDIRADCGFFIEDERACKVGFDVKGASGCKLCLYCKAICASHLHPAEGDYYVRFTEPDRSKWDPMTLADIKEVIQEIDAVKDNDELLKEMQTNTGINYNPQGPLWDPYLVELLDVPNCHYWDAMHCLYSSGGVAQYQTNGFIFALMELGTGFGLEDLDGFLATVKGHRLPKVFFQDRFVRKKEHT